MGKTKNKSQWFYLFQGFWYITPPRETVYALELGYQVRLIDSRQHIIPDTEEAIREAESEE